MRVSFVAAFAAGLVLSAPSRSRADASTRAPERPAIELTGETVMGDRAYELRRPVFEGRF